MNRMFDGWVSSVVMLRLGKSLGGGRGGSGRAPVTGAGGGRGSGPGHGRGRGLRAGPGHGRGCGSGRPGVSPEHGLYADDGLRVGHVVLLGAHGALLVHHHQVVGVDDAALQQAVQAAGRRPWVRPVPPAPPWPPGEEGRGQGSSRGAAPYLSTEPSM